MVNNMGGNRLLAAAELDEGYRYTGGRRRGWGGSGGTWTMCRERFHTRSAPLVAHPRRARRRRRMGREGEGETTAEKEKGRKDSPAGPG